MSELSRSPVNHLFELLIQSSPDGICAFDEKFRYTYWSPGMAAITGEPAENVLGKCAFDLFPFLKQVGQEVYFERALAGEATVAPLRNFHSPRSGRSGYTEALFSPLRDKQGLVIGGMAVVRDVRARALKEANEQMYRTIAESIPHIVWLTDHQTKTSFFNQRWYDYTGFTGETPYQASRTIVHPDDLEDLLAVSDQARANEAPYEKEVRLRNTQGDYRWFLCKGVSIQGIDGNTLCRLGTATDIHEQKIAIENAREAHERFRVLVEQTPFAFQLYSRKGDHLYANPAWEKIWQTSRDVLKDYNILSDLHSHIGNNAKLLSEAFNGSVVTIPEFYYDPAKMGNDGRPRWLKTHFFPVRNSHGELVQIAQVLEDVTSETNSLQRDMFLSKASKFLGSTLEVDEILMNIVELCVEQSADLCAIDLLEEDGNLRRVKAAGTDDLHRTFIPIMEKCPPAFHILKHPAIQALQNQRTVAIPVFNQDWREKSTVSQAHHDLMKHTKPKSLIAVPLLARGRPLGVLTVIYTEMSGRTYNEMEVSLFEEIAERTAAAIDNAQLYRKSQQAVVVRDTFLSIASHELKTPLTTLQLQLKLIHRWVNEENSVVDVLNRMKPVVEEAQHGIRRITRLVEDMLDISKIASGRLQVLSESLNLSCLTEDICKRLGPFALESGTTIHFRSTSPVYGEWDGMRIEQVISNLIMNACRYGEKTPIHVRVWQDGNDAYVSVQDQGRGIAPQDQKRIFERFERAVSEYEVAGFGLGLFIAQEIVSLHKGDFKVESELGKGAIFTVRLPLSFADSELESEESFSYGLRQMPLQLESALMGSPRDG